ncbi:MAG: exodeoxyribonuclease VII large subunit [Holosporales bacterium]|jgi:exodeoxyribonuclease VII large subunit|nr:exodeoxyribonuclease VII large subunit [Holosporales bacterium]
MLSLIKEEQFCDFASQYDVILSIAEISQRIKQSVESNFAKVRVRGEISGLKRHHSGHSYFSLKEEGSDSILNAICWRGVKTLVNLEDGLEIIASGRITTYPGRSNYQLIVANAETSGQGSLLKLLHERKQKLLKEGLFDKKRELPKFPSVVGVITSPSGAVIQDIIHRISDRFPCRVVLWPVAVQGAEAADQIVAAVDGFNRDIRPDVIIIARGGGSVEDLWSFNEECVVRAIYNSDIPTIAAIGHETDTTLADFAADRRAPTPTAAAEFATPNRIDVLLGLQLLADRFVQALLRKADLAFLELKSYKIPDFEHIITEQEMRLDDRYERLIHRMFSVLKDMQQATLVKLLSPINKINALIERSSLLCNSLKFAASTILHNTENTLYSLIDLLEAGSYTTTLKRGFCLLLTEENKHIESAKTLISSVDGPSINAHFYDGVVAVQVDRSRINIPSQKL